MTSFKFSYILAFALLFHCLGCAQLASAYFKDKSGFVRMMAMTEEETKKEKDDKADDDTHKEYKPKFQRIGCQCNSKVTPATATNKKEPIPTQFISELPTPPPDFTV